MNFNKKIIKTIQTFQFLEMKLVIIDIWFNITEQLKAFFFSFFLHLTGCNNF